MVSGARVILTEQKPPQSLNPCFSGGWSRGRQICLSKRDSGQGLNPCFSGGWSRRLSDWDCELNARTVLILVLVEDGLGEFANKLFAILIMWS